MSGGGSGSGFSSSMGIIKSEVGVGEGEGAGETGSVLIFTTGAVTGNGGLELSWRLA